MTTSTIDSPEFRQLMSDRFGVDIRGQNYKDTVEFIDARITAAPTDRDAMLEDALSAILWMYRRLPQAYGCLPSVEKSIRELAWLTGYNPVDDLKERATRVAVHCHDAAAEYEANNKTGA